MEARGDIDISSSQNTLRSFLSHKDESHPFSLSQWQREQISGMSPSGTQCMIDSWISLAMNPIEEPYCNATWDEIYCWPPTLAGTTVRRACSEVMKDDKEVQDAQNVIGDAFRICTSNATWLWDKWTNYNDCISGIDDLEGGQRQISGSAEDVIREVVRYILFVGSISSLVCLSVALFIFYYFKYIRCDRIIIQVHLMLSLVLRYILLIVISEPFIFKRSSYTYRSVDWVCKVTLASQFYAMVASVNWMFIQGHYLHTRLTSNSFDSRVPFRFYYFLGWGVPLIPVLIWSFLIELYHPYPCWKNYGDLSLNWIIIGPMLSVLLINFIFLLNIIRILITKIKPASAVTDSQQFLRAVKATLFLFPLLGFNFLIFCYNPGGTAGLYYILTNSICQTLQGIFVSIFYCFYCKDVRKACRRLFNRMLVRRHVRSSQRIIKRHRVQTMRAKTRPGFRPRATSKIGNSNILLKTIVQNVALQREVIPMIAVGKQEERTGTAKFHIEDRIYYITTSEIITGSISCKEKARKVTFSDIM